MIFNLIRTGFYMDHRFKGGFNNLRKHKPEFSEKKKSDGERGFN